MVEVDEVFVVKRKYHVGKALANEKIIVFGITEREGGPVQVLNEELYNYIRKKERFKARKAGQNEQNVQGHQPGEQLFHPVGPVREGGVHLESHPGLQTNGQDPHDAFSFNDTLEKEEQKLFGPKVKTRPRRTLFFMVPNRRRNTLSAIINQYVVPGSILFSDGWSGYGNLDNLQHYVVVHKERFVMYHFMNNFILKITTNHIEREWVELRKYIRGLPPDMVRERLFEVSYRLFRLSTGNINDNLRNIYEDIAEFCRRMNSPTTPSAFVPSSGGFVVG